MTRDRKPALTARWCPYCGHAHERLMCPRVTAVDYFADGKVRRVQLTRLEPWMIVMKPPVVEEGGAGERPEERAVPR